jgi:hypothetical protein
VHSSTGFGVATIHPSCFINCGLIFLRGKANFDIILKLGGVDLIPGLIVHFLGVVWTVGKSW